MIKQESSEEVELQITTSAKWFEDFHERSQSPIVSKG